MAVRQYIGARYVPKFAGEWNNATSYEPLTIVTNLGNSYTSKKAVPVGIQITNTEYWALTGTYNSQISELTNEVNEISDKLDNTPTKRRFILLSDSYGYGIQGGGAGWTTGWLEYCKNTFIGSDVYYLDQTDEGTRLEGTIGFATSLPFITVLQAIPTRTPIEDPGSITDIIVIGGNNDTAEESTIKAAISSFVTYAKNTYKNANISIGVLGYNARRMYDDTKMYDKYRAGALANGCNFISDLLLLAIDPQYYSDGTHVNAAGYAYINPYIAQAVLSGHCSYTQEAKIAMTKNEDVIEGIANVDYALRVDWNEHGFKASLIDSYRNTPFPFRPKTPTTSGTLNLSSAMTATEHMIMLPKQYYPISGVSRYGQTSGGLHALVGKGIMYITGNAVNLNAGFYVNSIVLGATFANQFVDWDYPSSYITI